MLLPFTMTAIKYPVLHILFQPCSTVNNFHIQKGNPYISSNNISVNNVGRGFIDLATRWQNTNIQLIDDNSEQNVALSVDQLDTRPVFKVDEYWVLWHNKAPLTGHTFASLQHGRRFPISTALPIFAPHFVTTIKNYSLFSCQPTALWVFFGMTGAFSVFIRRHHH